MNLETKRAIVKDLLASMTESAAVQKYKTSNGTVRRVRKMADELMAKPFVEQDSKRCRVMGSKFVHLEAKILEVIRKGREKKSIITCGIIQRAPKALSWMSEIGIDEGSFSGSNGWLQNFKESHNLINRILQGERADAPLNIMEGFKLACLLF